MLPGNRLRAKAVTLSWHAFADFFSLGYRPSI